MAQVLNKENITISIGEYQKDGKTKQEYRTIGELITMQGDDGSTYQFGRIWGAGGAVKFNVYAKDDNSQQNQQQSAPQQPPQQQNQQQAQRPAPAQNQPQGVQQRPQAQQQGQQQIPDGFDDREQAR